MEKESSMALKKSQENIENQAWKINMKQLIA